VTGAAQAIEGVPFLPLNCHPRKETVDALTAALGGAGAGTVHAFPSTVGCTAGTTDA
jgi:hypothetical protein